MTVVAFDIDDTLWKVEKTSDGRFRQVPDYDLIAVLRWFYNNGDTVYVWSAEGIDHAKMVVEKLGIDGMVTVTTKGEKGNAPHITFDDEDILLGRVNIKVKRDRGKEEY